MDIVHEIFGEGKELNMLQMSCRGVVIFIVTLIEIRISGRRSFGLKMPVDNIIVIVLGALLSRAIVGVSPFVPVVVSSFVIVILHRIFGWLVSNNSFFSWLVEGNKILLFENGKFIHENLRKALVCEEDVMQGIRKSAQTEQLDKIDKVFIERNGEISAVKKEQK